MDALSPPTDNLYKFLALTGIVILVLSCTFPRITRQSLDEKAFRLQETIASMNIDQQEASESIARVNTDVVRHNNTVDVIKDQVKNMDVMFKAVYRQGRLDDKNVK